MKKLRIFLSLILIFVIVDLAAASAQWVNNITVNEYNITWNYTERFTGVDSTAYKINIDKEIGNNDSFINAWELLNIDKDARNKFKSSLENEPDVRIDNETSGIEIFDVDSSLSREIIGKTHDVVTIENKYKVTYRLKESINNAGSIWFLGAPKSSITILLPESMDVLSISGMDNETRNINLHTEISGNFSNLSGKRGKITINLTKNESFHLTYNESNISELNSSEKNENITEPASEISNKISNWSIIGIGFIFIILIYIFKIRRY